MTPEQILAQLQPIFDGLLPYKGEFHYPYAFSHKIRHKTELDPVAPYGGYSCMCPLAFLAHKQFGERLGNHDMIRFCSLFNLNQFLIGLLMESADYNSPNLLEYLVRRKLIETCLESTNELTQLSPS